MSLGGLTPCLSPRHRSLIPRLWCHRWNSIVTYHRYSFLDNPRWTNSGCVVCSCSCRVPEEQTEDTNQGDGDLKDRGGGFSSIEWDRRFVLSSIVAMMIPVGEAMALEPLTQTYRSSSQGFAFSYPESFVIAFDRTSKNIEDGAVISVGDFKRFITVTVFTSHMPVEKGDGILNVETGYDMCIRPIVESETTMGFRVIREEMKESSGVFDFEYDHSICRGEQIESSGGILRCIVRVMTIY